MIKHSTIRLISQALAPQYSTIRLITRAVERYLAGYSTTWLSISFDDKTWGAIQPLS